MSPQFAPKLEDSCIDDYRKALQAVTPHVEAIEKRLRYIIEKVFKDADKAKLKATAAAKLTVAERKALGL